MALACEHMGWTMTDGNFRALDRARDSLKAQYPGWNIWWVPGQGRSTTWCAQPLPLINQHSPEDLAEAIERAMKEHGLPG